MNYFKTFLLMVLMGALFLGIGYIVGGEGGMAIALVLAVLFNFGMWFYSDKLVLSMYKAQEVDERSHPNYYNMVKMLAANAEIPMPKVYIVPSDVPNAFATGRDPNHAAVAATSGILRILSHEELEGVMAHELTHVKNRDSLIMTIAASVTTAIMFLTRFALWFGRGRDNPLGLIGLLLMVILAPIAAILIKSAISRTREYAADRGGAEISGKPQALASALAKISGINQNIKDNPLADNTTAHLWIASPLSGGGIMNLFSTHPPTEERIKRLMEM